MYTGGKEGAWGGARIGQGGDVKKCQLTSCAFSGFGSGTII